MLTDLLTGLTYHTTNMYLLEEKMTTQEKLDLAMKALKKIANKTNCGYCYANTWGLFRFNKGMNTGLEEQAQVANNALADIWGFDEIYAPEEQYDQGI